MSPDDKAVYENTFTKRWELPKNVAYWLFILQFIVWIVAFSCQTLMSCWGYWSLWPIIASVIAAIIAGFILGCLSSEMSSCFNLFYGIWNDCWPFKGRGEMPELSVAFSVVGMLYLMYFFFNFGWFPIVFCAFITIPISQVLMNRWD